jgi:hypothetical protein
MPQQILDEKLKLPRLHGQQSGANALCMLNATHVVRIALIDDLIVVRIVNNESARRDPRLVPHSRVE